LEYPSPDDPDRFEERLRTRFLIAAAAIFVMLFIGIMSFANDGRSIWSY
jgi:hypothetical protein